MKSSGTAVNVQVLESGSDAAALNLLNKTVENSSHSKRQRSAKVCVRDKPRRWRWQVSDVDLLLG